MEGKVRSRKKWVVMGSNQRQGRTGDAAYASLAFLGPGNQKKGRAVCWWDQREKSAGWGRCEALAVRTAQHRRFLCKSKRWNSPRGGICQPRG